MVGVGEGLLAGLGGGVLLAVAIEDGCHYHARLTRRGERGEGAGAPVCSA